MAIEVAINGEKFNLAPETLEGILDCMDKTAKDGKEHGFLLCDTSEGVTPGKKCVGTKCSIHLEDCGKSPVIGSFHSHPTVISFSMGDYLMAVNRAKEHPENKHLTCVSLVDKGVRCKAVKEIPPPEKKFSPIDTEEGREEIKPFFTKRVNIGLNQVAKLLEGVPWEELPPSEVVTAIDEMEDVCAGTGKGAGYTPEGCPVGGYPWPEEPTGKYPWSAKPMYKSVEVDGQIFMVPIPPAEILSPETEFIDIKSIETPDPALIAMGEAKAYADALAPVQLLKEKDEEGKWKIHDGRHRLVGWKVAGYKQAPVVFVQPAAEE